MSKTLTDARMSRLSDKIDEQEVARIEEEKRDSRKEVKKIKKK